MMADAFLMCKSNRLKQNRCALLPIVLSLYTMRSLFWLLLLLQDRSLSAELDRLVAQSGLGAARIGVHLLCPATDEVLYSKNDTDLYTLASNTKVLTCAAALDRLGPDFQFQTQLYAETHDSTATLYVTGNGDPNLSARLFEGDPTALFRRWANALQERGIRKVDDVVLVNEGFDEETLCPSWKRYDPWPWWAAPFGTFSLNDNCIDLTLEPGEEGRPAKITTIPNTKYVTILNRTETVRGGETWGFTRKAGTNEITLTGEFPAGAKPITKSVAIHDPYRFFGTVLQETLRTCGLEVTGTIRMERERKATSLLDSHTTDLANTIQVCLRVSQNFYAETLLRSLGRERKGYGSRENGLAVVRDFLQEIGIADYEQSDGSGLSRENRMSPRDLVKVFRHMSRHRHAKIFFEALAVNGAKEGTLRKRMTHEEVVGRIHAKTGHIRKVANLSGYIDPLKGERLIFSILVNDANETEADRLQDRICEFLIRSR